MAAKKGGAKKKSAKKDQQKALRAESSLMKKGTPNSVPLVFLISRYSSFQAMCSVAI